MKLTNPNIRIILADDHKLILQAYSSLLSEAENIEIAGTAGNGKEALELLNNTSVDVIILDANMPVMNGFETLKTIRKNHGDLKIIILSMHTDSAFISSYLAGGANAFLGKNCEQQELLKAIYTVVRDGYYFSSTVSRSIITHTLPLKETRENGRLQRLTERETDVMKLICADVPNEDIAKTLNISANTLKFFRKKIYRKTNTSSLIGLIKYAIKNGIFTVE